MKTRQKALLLWNNLSDSDKQLISDKYFQRPHSTLTSREIENYFETQNLNETKTVKKTILIPETFIKSLFNGIDIFSNDIFVDINHSKIDNISVNEEISNILWLGLINQFLSDKANAKKIVSVEEYNTGYDDIIAMDLPSENDIINGISDMSLGELEHITSDCLRNGQKSYLVTYIESEMIATQEQLQDEFNEGRERGYYY